MDDERKRTTSTDVTSRLQHRSTLTASVAALLLGTALTILLHEGGHWISGAILGSPSTLYQFGVTYADVRTPQAIATTAIAGPAVSLVLGLLMTTWLPFRRRGGTPHLLWLWIGFTSVQEAVTYLVITPFGAGDTATAVNALGGGAIVSIVLLVIGIAGMFWNAKRFAVHVRRHAGDDLMLARCLAWFPWLIGVVWIVLVQIVMLTITPMDLTVGERIITAVAGVSITVFAPMSFIFLHRTAVEFEPLRLPRWPIGLIVGYVVMLVVNLVLSLTGPTIG